MKIHFVKKGDTLYEISQKYGVTLEALIEANPQLEDPDKLMPGMKIKIPAKPAALTVSPAPKVPNTDVAPLTTAVEEEEVVEVKEEVVNTEVPAENGVKDLFKYDHIPAEPAASLYDLPAMEEQPQVPWGMPYPQMNALFPQADSPCGCGGTKNEGQGNAYPSVNGWAGQLPYANWLPYAYPHKMSNASPQGVPAQGVDFPVYPVKKGKGAGKGRQEEGEVRATTSQADSEAVSSERVKKKASARRKKPANPAVAKIRQLSRKQSNRKSSKQTSLPWITR